jgi:uncharacterized protein
VYCTRGFQELTRKPSDLIFWRDRWYNVFQNFSDDGTFHNFYCNVTMPLALHDLTISFVDLDLDVQIWSDGSCRVLGRDEFELHRVKYAYPEWVQDQALHALDNLLGMVEARSGPFSILPLDGQLAGADRSE